MGTQVTSATTTRSAFRAGVVFAVAAILGALTSAFVMGILADLDSFGVQWLTSSVVIVPVIAAF